MEEKIKELQVLGFKIEIFNSNIELQDGWTYRVFFKKHEIISCALPELENEKSAKAGACVTINDLLNGDYKNFAIIAQNDDSAEMKELVELVKQKSGVDLMSIHFDYKTAEEVV